MQYKTNALLGTLLAITLSACSNTAIKEEKTATTQAPTEAKAPVIETKPIETKTISSITTAPLTSPQKSGSTSTTSPPPTVESIVKKPTDIVRAPDQRSVYFEFDKYEIREEFKNSVAIHGKFLVEKKSEKILIQGNADERGSREYNLALGQRRADIVKRSLLLQGVQEEQIESVSLGEEKPKAPGHDEDSWAENRRADMLYRGEY